MKVGKTSGVYSITNVVNGKRYIGQSVHVESRWAVHRRYLRSGRHWNPYLQAAWGKYGESFFKFEVLVVELDRTNLVPLEAATMLKYGSRNREFGYNLQGAQGVIGDHDYWMRRGLASRGWKHTEDAKRKMSEWHTGVPMPDDVKARMSDSHKGKIRSEEHCLHLSQSLKETMQNRPDLREAVSKALKGRPKTPEHRAKLKEAWKTRAPMSEETKRKIGDGNRGKFVSDDTKKKLGEARRDAENARKA